MKTLNKEQVKEQSQIGEDYQSLSREIENKNSNVIHANTNKMFCFRNVLKNLHLLT